MNGPTDPYATLEVAPQASAASIEAAYARLRALLADDQLAAYGMLAPDEVAAQRSDLDAAYALLSDPGRRAAFDARAFGAAAAGPAWQPADHGAAPPLGRSIYQRRPQAAAMPRGPGGSPQTPGPAASGALASPLLQELPEQAQFNGPLLRRLRESAGASLDDFCERTKISRRYLKAIEADDYGLLPATVYVRGFVKAYAKLLGLEGKRVADSYLAKAATTNTRL